MQVTRSIPRQSRGRTELHVLCASGAHEALPCESWEITASYLPSPVDLQSLTPLSVVGCCRLKLQAVHWTTSVTLLQIVYNSPHKFMVIDFHWVSPG